MIFTQQARSLSPIHKSTMFSGDMMSYPSFIAAFEVLIESQVDNPSECLCFLDQYTSGKVKELFQGCLQMKCKDLQKVAKQLLQKHIQGCKCIHHKTIELARTNSITLEQASNAITGMHYMNDLSTANVLRQLWEKLPRYLGSKWTEGVGRIRSNKYHNSGQHKTRRGEIKLKTVQIQQQKTGNIFSVS